MPDAPFIRPVSPVSSAGHARLSAEDLKAVARQAGTEPAADSDSPRLSLQAELSAEDLAEVARLAARDREVRIHESQHLAAAGDLAVGGVQYTYQTGPDGKLYVSGGEVRLRLSPGRTPEETLSRALRAQAAALAPGDPSGPDLAVASQAARMASAARQDRAAQIAASNTGTVSSAADLNQPWRAS